MMKHMYTTEDIALLKEIAETAVNFERLSDEFNTRAGTHIGCNALKSTCYRHGIHLKQHNGHFKPGHRNSQKQRLPIGEEVMRPNRNNHIYVKVSDNPVPYLEDSTRRNNLRWENYRRKCEIVYEQNVGKIPTGGMIVFLNGDKYDFRPENLYCIDRRIHAVMCRHFKYSENPDLTLAAIKWCELHYALKTL